MRARLINPAAQLLITGLVTWALMVWLGGADHLLYVWPLTVIQLALVMRSGNAPEDSFFQLSAAALGEVIACSLAGIPFWIGMFLAVAQVLEVGIAAAILTGFVTRFDDLKRRDNLLRFGMTVLFVPVAFDFLVAKPVSMLTHETVFRTWQIVFPADMLGLAVVLPLLMFATTGEYRTFTKLWPHLGPAIPSMILFVGVSIAIFAQTSNPFLYLVFPPLILVVFWLGLEGAAFVMPFLAVIACAGTAYRHGPFWLKTQISPEHRIIGLQVFLCTAAAVGLSVGALLDERRKAGRAAEEAQSIYQTLIQNSEDMIVLSTMDGSRIFVSPAVQRITGFTPEEFAGLKHLGGVHPSDRDLARTVLTSLTSGKMHHTFRYRVPCKHGGYRWVEALVRGYREGESGPASGYVATLRDISAQKENEESLQAETSVLTQENRYLASLAALDELTGIPNRRSFNQVLEQEAARHTRTEGALALLMLDVDDFKKYNDRYGHHAGDQCLHRIAQAVHSCIGRTSDLAARLGGEEFAVLLPSTNEAGARSVAASIQLAIRDLRIEHADRPRGLVSVSIGIAMWPPGERGETAQLIQHADRALYQSKRLGKNCISVYEESSPARV